MSYEKQNFQDGQVLTAEMLNKMEAWMAMAQPPREEVVEGFILPETTISGEGEIPIPAEFYLADGKTYIVNWNGTEYETVAMFSSQDGLYFIGNVGALSGGEGTGEPFVIMALNADAGGGIYGVAMPLDGSTEVTVSIFGDITTIYPLEEKFLPIIPTFDMVALGLPTVTDDEAVTTTLEDIDVFIKAFNRGQIRLRFNVNYQGKSLFTANGTESHGNGVGTHTIIASVMKINAHYAVCALLAHGTVFYMQVSEDSKELKAIIRQPIFFA